MKLTIKSGSKDKVRESKIEVSNKATVGDLKNEFKSICKKSIHRQSFKKELSGKVIRLEDDKKLLSDYGILDGDELIFKDLGPQIGYRTVFLVEYAGPMLFVLLYALRPPFIYGADASTKPFNQVALLGVICWVFHFLKREFETVFIHRFSRPTMPLTNIFKNCLYYWSFGAVIGYPLCSPSFKEPSDLFVKIGLGIFVASEIGNFICHVMLRNLRPAEGSLQRPIPTGFLFNFVSCPNYTFEVLSWVGYSLMVQIPFSWLFTIVGFLQMADWAMKKHKGYLKSYEKYKTYRRKALIPFIY